MVGNLVVEPSVLCVPGAADFRLPRSRTSNALAGPSGVEPEFQVSETCALSRLDDRPAWNRRPDSNRHFFVRTEAFYPLNDARVIGVAGGNRILVDGSTDRRLTTRPRPHLLPGARVERASLYLNKISFSDWRLDRDGLPGELGGRGGNRTLICWVQASRPPVGRLPQNRLRAGSKLDGAPCQSRTDLSGLQIRHIAIYAYRARNAGANGANRTLVWRLPCASSATELHRLEPEGVLETPPSALRLRRSSTSATPALASLLSWSECGESNSDGRTGGPMPSQ